MEAQWGVKSIRQADEEKVPESKHVWAKVWRITSIWLNKYDGEGILGIAGEGKEGYYSFEVTASRLV